MPAFAFVVLWVGWAVSWFAASFWADATEKRASLWAGAPYRIVIGIGGLLFLVPAHGYYGPMRLWFVNLIEAWICVALTALGIAIAWWARIYLGRLWSGSVTKKAGHHVVDGGPYAIVRHPIYTGMLLATYATMAAKGTVWGIAGALLITIGIWLKARLEERFLREELGAEAYDSYRRRVPMLVPFGPKSA